MKKNMLLLIFEAGDGRYAMAAELVVEIIPRVRAKKIPGTPSYVVGLMNYHGKAVPVIDLCMFRGDALCEERLSTRIIMIKYEKDEGDHTLVGLLAEKVTETVQVDKKDFHAGGVLIGVGLDGNGTGEDSSEMMQWFDVKRFLPESVMKDLLRV